MIDDSRVRSAVRGRRRRARARRDRRRAPKETARTEQHRATLRGIAARRAYARERGLLEALARARRDARALHGARPPSADGSRRERATGSSEARALRRTRGTHELARCAPFADCSCAQAWRRRPASSTSSGRERRRAAARARRSSSWSRRSAAAAAARSRRAERRRRPRERPGARGRASSSARPAQRASARARASSALCELVAARARELADGMSFAFLYDAERALFSSVTTSATRGSTRSYYDLLASEARLASLVAIAKGDVPQEHWFRLARPRAALTAGTRAPLVERLDVRVPDAAARHPHLREHAARRDLRLGRPAPARTTAREHDVPWGVSESAYNVMDLAMTYQYRAFGVPGLGLKAGLAEDLVIAPYATVLAALRRPGAAPLANLRALAREGARREYGYYEAIDYTPRRACPPGARGVVVKAFMAHHQGMTLVALDNVLHDGPMQRRFHADPRIKASELLLEERVPRAPCSRCRDRVLAARCVTRARARRRASTCGLAERRRSARAPARPWRAVTLVTGHRHRPHSPGRARHPPLPRGCGARARRHLLYLREPARPAIWSAGYQPTRGKPDCLRRGVLPSIASSSSAATATSRRVHRDRPSRRASRRGAARDAHQPRREAREIEITTLHRGRPRAARGRRRAHRAFSGMFVETEALPSGARSSRTAARARRESPAVGRAGADRGGRACFGELEHETSRAAVPRSRPHARCARARSTPGRACRAARAPCSIRRSRCAARVRLAPRRARRITLTTRSRRHARASSGARRRCISAPPGIARVRAGAGPTRASSSGTSG